MTATIPSLPAVHGGATRREAIDRIRGLGGANLREEIGRRHRYIGRHWADNSCTQVIPVIDPTVLTLVVDLDQLADEVTTVDRAPAEDCAYCLTKPRPADVEIYTIAEPGDEEEHECICSGCVREELKMRPRFERVRIEVCTG